jgi:plasmid stabilization system protein ParE
MIPRIIVLPRAEQDLRDAADYYDHRQAGLGDMFLDHVVETMCEIRANPQLFATMLSDVRRASVSRFPYGIFYRILGETIAVLAVYHSSRDPRSIEDRI